MSIFDIIYNAKSETHKACMDVQLTVFKTLVKEFYRSEENSWYRTNCAIRAKNVLERIEESDEVVYRTVYVLYKDEITEIYDELQTT